MIAHVNTILVYNLESYKVKMDYKFSLRHKGLIYFILFIKIAIRVTHIKPKTCIFLDLVINKTVTFTTP